MRDYIIRAFFVAVYVANIIGCAHAPAVQTWSGPGVLSSLYANHTGHGIEVARGSDIGASYLEHFSIGKLYGAAGGALTVDTIAKSLNAQGALLFGIGSGKKQDPAFMGGVCPRLFRANGGLFVHPDISDWQFCFVGSLPLF